MKNFIQDGEVVTIAAPSGGVSSGDPVLIGNLFGVAAYSASTGASVEIAMEGVFDLPKAAAITFAVGDKAYFDATAKNITSVSSGNKWVGITTQAALGGDATARVRLNEIAI